MDIAKYFTQTLKNRLHMPEKHILVCEDVILQQARISKHFSELFEHEGKVEVSFVSGGIAAAAIIETVKVDLVLLDHDMPNGSGPELLKWMRETEWLHDIPVITFSGIDYNNDMLKAGGAQFKFRKDEVINGIADEVIKAVLQI